MLSESRIIADFRVCMRHSFGIKDVGFLSESQISADLSDFADFKMRMRHGFGIKGCCLFLSESRRTQRTRKKEGTGNKWFPYYERNPVRKKDTWQNGQ